MRTKYLFLYVGCPFCGCPFNKSPAMNTMDCMARISVDTGLPSMEMRWWALREPLGSMSCWLTRNVDQSSYGDSVGSPWIWGFSHGPRLFALILIPMGSVLRMGPSLARGV